MDPVIFTGRVPFQVFKHERPREFEQETANGTLDDKLTGPPSKLHLVWSYIFGLLCLLFGFSLVGMIIYAMIFQYK